jgi:hypothetical protein
LSAVRKGGTIVEHPSISGTSASRFATEMGRLLAEAGQVSTTEIRLLPNPEMLS